MAPKYLIAAIALSVFIMTTGASVENQKEGKVVKNGAVVMFDYTLTDDKGQVIDSSKGKQPMTYTQSTGQIIPGLEKAIAGMKVNDEKKVTVKPEEAYGPVDPKAVQEMPKSNLPPEAIKAGATLMARTPDGQNIPVRVQEVKDKTVVLDFNHPLAGKTLNFDVKVVDVKPQGESAKQPDEAVKKSGTK